MVFAFLFFIQSGESVYEPPRLKLLYYTCNTSFELKQKLLEEVCHDVAIEPILKPITGIDLIPSTANTNDGTRLDIRVFDPNTSQHQSKSLNPFMHNVVK